MIYASILKSDGHHAEFHADGGAETRSDVRIENGTMVLHVRDGDSTLRLRLGGAPLQALRSVLGESA